MEEQNLPMGILAGLVASVLGAILWAIITVSTGFQIGYMAIAIGYIVGMAVRFAGKGTDQIFGIVGGALALLGCLLGNALSLIGILANELGVGYFEVLGIIDIASIPGYMANTFNPIDLIFYGIAIYEGYHFSFDE